jgi:acyl-CoA synthetase (AMP-forming)/AMP-acid ligase II
MYPQSAKSGLDAFLAVRDFLLQHRDDYATAYRDFRWPQLTQFNWALDYFDSYARGNPKPCLWIVDETGSELKLSYDEISRRSNQVANFLRKQGVRRGDRIIVIYPTRWPPSGARRSVAARTATRGAAANTIKRRSTPTSSDLLAVSRPVA